MDLRKLIILLGCIGLVSYVIAGDQDNSNNANPVPASGRNLDPRTTSPDASPSPGSPSSLYNHSDVDDSSFTGSLPKHTNAPPREKVIEVEAAKLPTSGTDSKFKGSLLDADITSLRSAGAKTDGVRDANNDDSRFRTKSSSLEVKDAERKKDESVSPSASVKPSPAASPAATVSPTPKPTQ